jgi:PDZ domain/Aspartyl protease
MTHRLRIVLIGVVLAAPTVVGLSRSPTDPPARAVVPFELLPTNHMLVTATINGKGPYRLIFDVGSPVTLLNNKTSEVTGVVRHDAPRAFLFGMRGEAQVQRLQVGDLTAQDVPVLVMDHPLLKAMGQILKRPIDGLVGYTFFARYKTTIDYQARRMTFEPVDFQVRNLMKDLPERLAGPKVARRRVLAPGGLWGLSVGESAADLNAPGVPIRTVLPCSPAALAGLKPGDILTTLDGRWTTSVADTYAAASGVPAGQSVPVVVLRDGEELTLTVTVKPGL